jgi:IS5 family transposase
MRPKQHETTRSGDLFHAWSDQIINLKQELVQLADKLDRAWIDSEIAPLYSPKGRPGIPTRFGLLLLKHIYGWSDEGVCDRWVLGSVLSVLHRRGFSQTPSTSRPMPSCCMRRSRAQPSA